MYMLLFVIVVVSALVMIGIIVIQDPKGGILSSRFDEYKQMLGIQKSMSLVEKATWILGELIVLACVIMAYVIQ